MQTKHERKLLKWDTENPTPSELLMAKWDAMYPLPEEPELKHFHDPTAELTDRDNAILKVFSRYPPAYARGPINFKVFYFQPWHSTTGLRPWSSAIFDNWPGYPPFWGYLCEVVRKRDGHRCQVSGCPSRVTLHIHHKTPIFQGGEHVPTNLVSLCSFHHGLEPIEGHEKIWGKIKSRYFTMVRAHSRRNPISHGYYSVRAFVRRLQLTEESELLKIKNHYGLSCPFCDNSDLAIKVNKQDRQVIVQCIQCGERWMGERQLSEETGPMLA